MYIPNFLYAFIHKWIFRLIPCIGYCEQCCSEHGNADIAQDPGFQSFGYILNCGIDGSYVNPAICNYADEPGGHNAK